MWRQFVWPGLAFVGATLAAFVLRALILWTVRRTMTQAGPIASLVQAVRLPSLLWAVVFGFYVAVETAHLGPRLSTQLHLLLEAAIILSVTVTVAGLAGSLIGRAAERALGVSVTGWMQTSARLLVLIVGGLVLVSSLGIEITPILTALGIGGLAVALALQDTLSNLFAGMHLLADKPIRVGDYVKLSEGVEGVVVDIGWRSTRLRMLQSNIIIVPNQKVAQSIITNYDLPDSRMSLLLRVSVDYASDPERVEAVLVSEATSAIGQVPGLVGDEKPFVRFIPGFGDSSLDFTLICQVASFVDQYSVQHELRKRILRRLRAEGIEIPFPVRTVRLVADGPPAGSAESKTLPHERQ